jgi:tetratricopeptide (TPR) repeat protein
MGNWQIEILKYGSNGLVSEDTTTFYQRPHNDFIWILTEQGIFSFFLYLSILAVVYYNIVKIILHTQISDERTFFYLVFFGFTGYCVFSLFSFPKERAEHLLFMSFTIASVLIYKRRLFPIQNKTINSNFSFSILLLIFFVGLFSLLMSTMRLRSEKHLAKAFNARQNSDWKTMIHEIDLAESFFYHIDPVSTPLRWYRGLANFNLNNMQDALYDFKQAFFYNPYHVHVLNNLGTCYEMAGNHNEAIEYFQKAVDLSPTFDEARYNLCASYYNSGNGKKAYLELRKINHEKVLEKYNHFLNIVLSSGFKTMHDTADEDTKNRLDGILNTQEWINKIYFKSIENNISLEKQLILDLIYVSEIMEKDTVEASKLKNKYSVLLK